MGSCLSCSISLGFFFRTAPGCSDPGIDVSFCSVSEVCGLSEVFELSLYHFFPCQLVYLHCMHSLSCILSLPFVFLGQLSDFLSSNYLSGFPFDFLFRSKRARFSPSTSMPSEMSAFLKTSSITAVNSFGESGSPCLTPLFIGKSLDTNSSIWVLAIAWL